jgi:hypothetical protein
MLHRRLWMGFAVAAVAAMHSSYHFELHSQVMMRTGDVLRIATTRRKNVTPQFWADFFLSWKFVAHINVDDVWLPLGSSVAAFELSSINRRVAHRKSIIRVYWLLLAVYFVSRWMCFCYSFCGAHQLNTYIQHNQYTIAAGRCNEICVYLMNILCSDAAGRPALAVWLPTNIYTRFFCTRDLPLCVCLSFNC